MKKATKRILQGLRLTPNSAMAFFNTFFRFRFFSLFQFFKELRRYRACLSKPMEFALYPCLDDRKSETPVSGMYFYQDIWGAKMVFKIKPKKVIDIGSTALLVGIISQYTETESIDIRPIPASVPNLICRQGSVIDLPYPDSSVEYIMSLCVIEHIGLGRYGDPIDPQGPNKAAVEISRVIRPGGYLIISVPVGPPCIVFNAHQIFSKQEFLSMFPDFEVIEEVFCNPGYTNKDLSASLNYGEYYFYCVCLRKSH